MGAVAIAAMTGSHKSADAPSVASASHAVGSHEQSARRAVVGKRETVTLHAGEAPDAGASAARAQDRSMAPGAGEPTQRTSKTPHVPPHHVNVKPATVSDPAAVLKDPYGAN